MVSFSEKIRIIYKKTNFIALPLTLLVCACNAPESSTQQTDDPPKLQEPTAAALIPTRTREHSEIEKVTEKTTADKVPEGW